MTALLELDEVKKIVELMNRHSQGHICLEECYTRNLMRSVNAVLAMRDGDGPNYILLTKRNLYLRIEGQLTSPAASKIDEIRRSLVEVLDQLEVAGATLEVEETK